MRAPSLPAPATPDAPALEPVARRARNAPNPWTLGVGLGALCTWLALRRDFGPDGYFVPLQGLAIVLLGLAPGLAYLRRVRRDPAHAEPLPFLPIIGVVFAIYFGLPVLVRDHVRFMDLTPNVLAVAEALDLALLGLLALYAGFWLLAPRLLAVHARPLQVPWNDDRARSAAFAFIAVGCAALVAGELVSIPASIVQLVRLLTLMLRVGLGILIVLDLKGSTGRTMHVALWFLVVPAYLFFHLSTGQIGAFVRPLAFVLLLVWAYRFRLPWIKLAALTLCAILLRGAAPEFRTMVWRSNDVAALGPFESSALYAGIVRKNLATRPLETLDESVELIASRTSQLGLFAHAVHRTPEVVPYWGGETYKTLASSFVPRILWREKPTKELGQRFGHRYAAIGPHDRGTSVNLPQIVELFVNFGPLGVLFGMLALGVLYRLAYMKLDHPGASDGTTLIGAVVFTELINIESDFSLVFGGILQLALVLYVVLRLCAPRETLGPARSARDRGEERGSPRGAGRALPSIPRRPRLQEP